MDDLRAVAREAAQNALKEHLPGKHRQKDHAGEGKPNVGDKYRSIDQAEIGDRVSWGRLEGAVTKVDVAKKQVAIKADEGKTARGYYAVFTYLGSAGESSPQPKVQPPSAQSEPQATPSASFRGSGPSEVPINKASEKKVDEYQREALERWATVAHTSVGGVQEKGAKILRNLLDKGQVRIRVPDGAAVGILESGRIKSQFETGISGGKLNENTRGKAEETFFGYDKRMSGKDRPIYGYIDASDVEVRGSTKWVSQYGSIEFVLKDSVRARTSFTVGDSLDLTKGKPTVIPQPVTNPSIRAMDLKKTSPIADRGYSDRDIKGTPYIEAQVHGGVRVADIERVIIAGPPSLRSGSLEARVVLQKRLQDLGVPYSIKEG